MDLIELLLTVCTLAQPMTCEERRLVFPAESVTMNACVMRAQPYIAQWAGDHPALAVHRWRCAPGGDEKT